MRQKVNTSRLPVHLILFLLLISVPQLLFAQKEGDSTRIALDGLLTTPESQFQFAPLELNLFPKKTTQSPFYSPKQKNYLHEFSLKKVIRLPYQVNPSPRFQGDYRTGGVLKQFAHGEVFGSGGQATVPGIGLFNNASVGYRHQFNQKLALQMSVNAMKVNMSHITGQAFSTSGALLYNLSDGVTFKLFGSYDIGNSYGMSTNSYGATVSFDLSERFSMEMGAQRYYNSMRGRWETAPVVIPTFRIGKSQIGFDVGGLIYEILRETVFEKRGSGGGGGATVAPPRLNLPIR